MFKFNLLTQFHETYITSHNKQTKNSKIGAFLLFIQKNYFKIKKIKILVEKVEIFICVVICFLKFSFFKYNLFIIIIRIIYLYTFYLAEIFLTN